MCLSPGMQVNKFGTELSVLKAYNVLRGAV